MLPDTYRQKDWSSLLETITRLDHLPTAANDLQKVAIIDVGSNSFRLIVITYLPGVYFQLTDEVRETVRLVHNLGATGRLSRESMSHALDAMRLYAAFCRASDIKDIRAVATSAVREADNREEFLARVKRETGLQVRLLSGQEEAYYGYLAAVNSTTLRNGYVMDLGGGSMQITRVVERDMAETVSFTLGAVRTTEDWLPELPPTKDQVAKLRKHVREQLKALKWFKPKNDLQFVAEGGSLRNLARIAQKRSGYPLEELHGYQLPYEALKSVVRELETMTPPEKLKMPGMKPDRADIALAAGIVIEEVMRHCEAEYATVCGQGLREGVFYERFFSMTNGGITPDHPPRFENVRQASVLNIAHLYRFQARHADHVAYLSLSLFDQMASFHRSEDEGFLTPAEREILWAACILHDIGMAIDYNDHHRHSYYLILNSGLPGWTHRELALIALAARFHRKGMPTLDELAGALQSDDMQRLLRITACLRLAEQLDRSRDGAIHDVYLEMREDRCILHAMCDDDPTVAIWSAQTHTEIFRLAFGIPLEIVG